MSTGPTPKVSRIAPPLATPKAEADQDTGVAAPSDTYQAGSSDAFKGLVAGCTRKANVKADTIDPSVISEMYDVQEEAQDAPRNRYEAMQGLLGNLMQGDVLSKFPKDYLDNIPYVPKLSKDILTNGKEALVERYSALEKTLLTLLKTVDDTLVPQKMYDLSSSEIRSLQAYREKLKESLASCRTELKLAKRYLQKQIERDLEAAREGKPRVAHLADDLSDHLHDVIVDL